MLEFGLEHMPDRRTGLQLACTLRRLDLQSIGHWLPTDLPHRRHAAVDKLHGRLLLLFELKAAGRV